MVPKIFTEYKTETERVYSFQKDSKHYLTEEYEEGFELQKTGTKKVFSHTILEDDLNAPKEKYIESNERKKVDTKKVFSHNIFQDDLNAPKEKYQDG